VLPGNFDAFVEGVNAAVREQAEGDPEIFVPAIEVDAEVAVEKIQNGLLDWLTLLAPFGSGNRRPVFASGGLRVVGTRQLWEGMNLLRLEDGSPARLAGPADAVPGGPFDAVYTVSRSPYSGQAELEILDWRG
jgi:single-stranded-DNA-specific exonuclease